MTANTVPVMIPDIRFVLRHFLHECAPIYWRFMGGFARKEGYRRQPGRNVRHMQNLQHPYSTWVFSFALILDAGSSSVG
jgi:hypothetical protein